jgi:opacity protein-like surface antigen
MRTNIRMKRAVAVAFAAAAMAPSAAWAVAMAAPPAGVNGGYGPGYNGPQTQAQSTDAQIDQAPSSSGFDWGDAGIGAAGVLGMVGLGAGVVTVARRDRSPGPVTG